MELYEAIAARRSVRKYTDTPVEPEKIARILEAGRLAPSWKNRQCWRFVLLSDAEKRQMLGTLIDNPSVECYTNAPYVLVLCADSTDSGSSGGKEYYLVDCGICMAQIALAATAEGLGTCWVGYFPENPVRSLVGAPMDTRIVAITPIGYAAEAPEARPRQPLSQLVFAEGWQRG